MRALTIFTAIVAVLMAVLVGTLAFHWTGNAGVSGFLGFMPLCAYLLGTIARLGYHK